MCFYKEHKEDYLMSIEKLQELLDSGAITQEEFDEMAKNIAPSTSVTETKSETEIETEIVKDDKPSVDEKLFQAKLDREMAKERKKSVELKRKLERLEKKILTDEEQKQNEFERQQQELEEQRKELAYETNKRYAVKSMKKAEIGDSEEALLLMEKLVLSCEDETEIDDMISLLKAWKDKDVKTEVDKRFKEGGYTPKKSEALNNGVNPFKQETLNLTEQIKLLNCNPDLAARLKAEAGVK